MRRSELPNQIHSPNAVDLAQFALIPALISLNPIARSQSSSARGLQCLGCGILSPRLINVAYG
jgi:hypothetical protein